jgi:nickel-dependent lactate racemase
MNIDLHYGRQRVTLQYSGDVGCISTLEPRRSNVDAVRLALAVPIDSPRISELVHPGQKIAIITSDITRPCPSERLLPPIMDELTAAGVRDVDVTVIFGLGSHRKQTDAERERLVGSEMTARLRCIDSDPNQTVFIGRTSRGTPIEVFEPVMQANVRIVLGNVEPHYFAGYSGGAKALVPGVCSVQTIRSNHALMVDSRARAGNITDNPVRLDIEEGAAMIGIDFMLNVVLDSEKNILAAAAGNPTTAHRWACRVVDALSTTPIHELADIVIVSSGGYPKDINMYQAQKALDNAAVAVKTGGQIIWVAECPEGLGHQTFEKWMVGSKPAQILERIQQDFVLGGHKAAAIARVQQRAVILLVSALPDELVQACNMEPYPDLDTAFKAAVERSGQKPVITVIPEGGSVLPKVALIPDPST